MAFELRGPTTTVFVEDNCSEIFELPKRYGEVVSFLPQIAARFYDSFVIYPAMIPQLRDELIRLRRRWEDERVPELRRERKVFSKDQSVERRTLHTLLLQEPIYVLFNQLVGLCDECIASDTAIECVGD